MPHRPTLKPLGYIVTILRSISNESKRQLKKVGNVMVNDQEIRLSQRYRSNISFRDLSISLGKFVARGEGVYITFLLCS